MLYPNVQLNSAGRSISYGQNITVGLPRLGLYFTVAPPAWGVSENVAHCNIDISHYICVVYSLKLTIHSHTHMHTRIHIHVCVH